MTRVQKWYEVLQLLFQYITSITICVYIYNTGYHECLM